MQMVFLSRNSKKVFDKEDIPHNPTSASKLSEASGKIDIFQKLTCYQPPPLWSFSYLEYIERGSKHGVDVRAGAF